MKLTSSTFVDGKKMPKEFTKFGTNRIPPLEISGDPNGTKSLAIIMHDPNAPYDGYEESEDTDRDDFTIGRYGTSLWTRHQSKRTLYLQAQLKEKEAGIAAATTDRSSRSVPTGISFTVTHSTQLLIFLPEVMARHLKLQLKDT